MNIQRKYSLPNCTLLLEGLSDATRAAHFQELRPELSILVNAEFYISGYNHPLAGGRDFFESLVRAVSAYAQEFLSNVPNPQAHNQETELVQLQKINSNRHRLVVNSDSAPQDSEFSRNSTRSSSIQVDLNTVQLFDLVEAIDQFFADSQTLPELSLQLQPVGTRYGGPNQAILKQALPASVGVSSLAVAAIAFSFVPVPHTRAPQPKTQEQGQASPATSNISNSTPAALTATSSPSGNERIGATPEFTPTSAFTPSSTPTQTPIASSAPTDLEALLRNSVSEITDASQLRALNRQVYNKINSVWSNRLGLNDELVYRLGVAADGAVVGYKAVNTQANDAVKNTPLPNLLYNPASRSSIPNEPIAQFRVVFTKKGVLEVSPWRGYTRTPDVVGSKITDANTIKNLNQNLSNVLRQNWGNARSFERDLKYRVAVNKDGIIADYEPLNQVAFDYFRETPLPKMFQSVYGSNVAAPNNKEALAHFQVVFKPNGTLEVNPWQGYK
ncbi:DUF4335 domain-containing protein [Aetokthonos hydrillicola Thurmond2011]|jgi:hypothetical protein|uniref:DUF4335 domain-containing protein n=1 Tax=Aetokthonos hydrillicola Thurmond2011 TaxID=2712845 RepID=A0AAP5MAM6_9CYAN|nr:DUF4335 domain-containing protein [Aetokthonos hydrillicola]MBO3461402.1 DUF4335 domain-containing protein [Aetokthonos hydrillicola CCALA 1050]MBW4586838.1 DUF4335 domain-containing protein [Aetokthonos hydrillicola CCALA 1050]MDR9895804.1 DUF4335 domain-containing protein [Aetokthonos hydrillicola Thurmond2011]